MELELKKIVRPLINWYKQNARDLPWREGKNAYHIWISEIMLQQTRIEAVKKYYDRFIKELPTIHDLAIIEEEKLLKLWEGLGYYNRARNLKKAAQIIEKEYKGVMPTTYQELIRLPGIGEYTAGAIASIAYNQKVPAVDGNVLRVVSRVMGSKEDILLASTKKRMTEKIIQIMPKEAGVMNEALMELGEIICIPNGDPLCDRCPLSSICVAKKMNLTDSIPIREKKIKRRIEDKTVFILECKGKVAILKREDKGLLANLYEFPNVEGHLEENQIEEVLGIKIKEATRISNYTHIFSHVEWNMIGYRIKVQKEIPEFVWATKEELKSKYPIPGAFEPFRKEYLE